MADEFLARELARFEQEVSTIRPQGGAGAHQHPGGHFPPHQHSSYPPHQHPVPSHLPPPPPQYAPYMQHGTNRQEHPPYPQSLPPPQTLAPPSFPVPFHQQSAQSNPIKSWLDNQMTEPAGPKTREPPPMEGNKAEPQHGVLTEAIAGVKRALAAAASGQSNPFGEQPKEKKKHYRTAAGERWIDDSLSEWPEGDHRIFVGDLGNEVNDDVLAKAFVKFPSFAKAKVVRDKRTNKTKGFGFVSFLDPMDFARAIREMDGKYIGNRPAKIRKSDWLKREDENGGKKRGFNMKNSKKKIRTLTL